MSWHRTGVRNQECMPVNGIQGAARGAPGFVMLAPPQAWSADGLGGRSASPERPAVPAASSATPDQLDSAWKHVRNVVAADSRPADLFDLLSHSLRETQYSSQPQGVSALLPAMTAPWSCTAGGGCRY